MLEDILPLVLSKPISLLNYKSLCEIRLRTNRPITVNYLNTYYFLGQAGLCNESDAIICTKDLIQTIISKVSNYSIYAINDEIKCGYISVKGGIRIGLTGDVVSENGKVLTIKNISSLNIRIPHQVNGCAYKVAKLLFDETGNALNTLILGSPGTGKTTILRDLCLQIYNQRKDLNVLLIDERNEISASFEGIPELNVGKSTDITCGGQKDINITNGIRSMSPDIIILDEIGTEQDVKALEYAVNTGVCIVASVHCKNIYELQKKEELSILLKNKSFKRFVELSNSNGKGTIENIYDENYKSILRFVW